MKNLVVGIAFALCCGLVVFGESACSDTTAKPGTAHAVGDNVSCPSLESMQAASASPYAQDLLRKLGQFVSLQSEAVNSGEAGQVIVCASINNNGNVRAAHIARSAGFPLLDGAVLYALNGMESRGQIGLPPAELASSDGTAWLALSVDFQPSSQPVRQAQGPHPCAERAMACPLASPTDFTFCPGLPPAEERTLQDRVQAAVVRELRYPPGAQRFDIEGKALVCLAADQKGEILDASLVVSSGSAWLDGEALMVAGRLQLKSALTAGYGPMQLPAEGAMVFMPLQWTIGR
jgi:TonB family protein